MHPVTQEPRPEASKCALMWRKKVGPLQRRVKETDSTGYTTEAKRKEDLDHTHHRAILQSQRNYQTPNRQRREHQKLASVSHHPKSSDQETARAVADGRNSTYTAS